jgi:hypothetical protein
MEMSKIVELRTAGYTWNQIDEMLIPDRLVRKNGKIVSQAYKFAAKKDPHGAAFTKAVIGAFTPTQVVVPLRKFQPFPKQEVSMVTEGGF